MARIDSILSIVVTQRANELRVASEREPKMLAFGAPKRLSIPKMSDETVRDMLGEILTPERDALVRANKRVELAYDAQALGTFHVSLTAQDGGGIAAVFVRAAEHAARARAAQPVADDASPAPAREAPREPRDAPGDERGAHVSEALAALVARAAALHASDVHLADGEAPFARVDGALRPLDDDFQLDVSRTLALGERDRDHVARHGSLDMGLDVAGIGRVRVHVYRAAEGLCAAVRLLPPAAPTLASLDLPMALDDLVLLPHGLVLICGATGSGKSTTLAALAQEALKRRSIVLVTLEDPIEYALTAPRTSLVRRRQIGRDAPDFASGLRDALREDPDVLLVGEMRDAETIALALTAAETGHLVLASMHSRSAASAIERIVDTYPPERQQQIRVQLADALRAIVGQRLVPRARGGGRASALEVLRVTHAVGSMIREGKTAQIASAVQSGRREGMLSLERCLADRVLAGDIRAEDAHAAANDATSLAQYLAHGRAVRSGA